MYQVWIHPETQMNNMSGLYKTKWTTLEQVKALENIITSGDIRVDEDDQLWGLYIIKLKCGIFMLDTNQHKVL